jgi:hypothetical protein
LTGSLLNKPEPVQLQWTLVAMLLVFLLWMRMRRQMELLMGSPPHLTVDYGEFMLIKIVPRNLRCWLLLGSGLLLLLLLL